MNQTFPREVMASQTSHDSSRPYFYGSYPFGTTTNTAYAFRGGGVEWLVVNVSFFHPTWSGFSAGAFEKGVMAWARKLISDAPEKRVILNTHSCLSYERNADGTVKNPLANLGTLNTAEKKYLYSQVTSRYPN